jgi:hypothetical protein
MDDVTVTNLSVARIHDLEALDHRFAEWQLLDEQMSPRTPFTSPLWITLWWKHFQRRNIKFRDLLYLHIVHDVAGRLVAVAPLMQSRVWSLPVLRVIQFLGNDPGLTEIRGVICRREDHARVIRVLTDYFMRRQSKWEIFRWNGLGQNFSEYDFQADGCEFIEARRQPSYIIDLPTSWDKLTARVTTKMRWNLRKPYECLKRDRFAFLLKIIERRGDVVAAVDRFHMLHAARSDAPDMVYHGRRFVRPHERAFLVEYLEGMAERGQLRIFELQINGKTVASRITFLLGSDLYMYYSGYDPSWRKYSIMTLLVEEIIKWAIVNRLQRVNLSTGKDQSKLRWKPREIIHTDCVQISRTLRGRLAFRGFRAYERLFSPRDATKSGR